MFPFGNKNETIYVDNVPVRVCRRCGEIYYEAVVYKKSATKEDNQPSSSNLPVELQAKQSKRASRRQTFSRFLVEKGPALTVLALVLSVLQFIYAGLGANKIDRIADSISTQYVDVFPNNMQEIISLINRTQRNLTVITDVAAYGHFSSPDNSREYIRALNELNNSKKGVHIQVLYYDSTKGKTKLAKQFKSEISNWEGFTKGKTYLNYARFIVRLEAIAHEEFLKADGVAMSQPGSPRP